jgi:hypothetical protein
MRFLCVDFCFIQFFHFSRENPAELVLYSSTLPSVIFHFIFEKFHREEDDVSIGEACKKSTDEFVDLLYESVRHGLESDAFTSSQ